jgi:hypothetical protein
MFRLKYLLLLFPFLLISCVDEDDMLGQDFVDPSDIIIVNKYSSFDISGRLFHEGDSLKTSDYRYVTLGSYSDNQFGKLTSSIYTQVSLSSSSIDFNFYKDSAQSLVLSLAYAGYFAKDTLTKNMNMRIELYKLSEDFQDSVPYYTNSTLAYSNLIKDTTIVVAPTERVQVGDDTNKLAPQLRLDLGQDLLQELLNSGSFASNKEFKNFFKGLYIKLTPVSDPNGMIAYFDMYSPNSGITLYYQYNGRVQKYNFVFASGSRSFVNIDYNFAATPLSAFAQLGQDTIICNDSVGDKSKMYLGSLGISIATLDINDLKQWYQTSTNNLAGFNQAMLILPVSEDYITSVGGDHNVPEKIICYRKDDNGKLIYIHDVFGDSDHFSGKYDKASKSYKMRITSHFQNYLNGNIKSSEIYLLPDLRTYKANRVVLNGPKHQTNPAKIEIIYTR